MARKINGKWAEEIEISRFSEFDPGDREEIGEAVLAFIRARTDRGLDKANRQFKGYSADYMKSLDFKNSRHKSGDTVNLKLTGDMMASLELLEIKDNGIVIGYDDEDEGLKAQGHTTGEATGKVRDFMGLTKTDLKTITRVYKRREEEDIETTSDLLTAILAAFSSRRGES